jgi:hypothetical protein
MDPTALPRRAGQDPTDGVLQAFVGVADDQLHPRQATALERAEECRPAGLVLAVADIDAEHFAGAVDGDAERHDHRPGDHPTLRTAGLDVGRVAEHVRERRVVQPAVPKRGDLLIKLGADPRHRRLRDARVDPEGFDQVVDLSR